MNPEGYGHHNPIHSEDFFDTERDRGDSFETNDGTPTEAEALDSHTETIANPVTIEIAAPETAKEERLGDLDERLRLLGIEKESASRAIDDWQSSPYTNPADFQYRVPHMKNRLNLAEHAITSTTLDRELVSADVETPESRNEVVRNFIRRQVLEGKVKSQREGIDGINKEESVLDERLAGYETTIGQHQDILDGNSSVVELTDDEWSQNHRRVLMDKIHRLGDKYESTLTEKMSGGFNERRAVLEEEIKAIQELGVTDEELPGSLQEDPDFAACLSEANFFSSEDDEAYKRRTGHNPEKEAVALFTKRFPHKAEYYKTLNPEPPIDADIPSQEVSESTPTPPEPVAENISPTEEVGPTEESLPTPEDENFSEDDLTFERNWKQPEELLTYITGLDIEDPKLVERLAEDKKIIRAKYDLPPLEMRREWPAEYERLLKKRMEDIGVTYKEEWEMGGFFEQNPVAGGVHLEKDGVISAKREDDPDYYPTNLGTLEHELIHALQHRNSPQMPIEAMEYEAYIGANLNADLLESEDDPKEIVRSVVIQSGIQISSGHWYRLRSQETGETVIPPWDSDALNLKKKIEKVQAFLKTSKIKTPINRKTFESKLWGDIGERYREFAGESDDWEEGLSLGDISAFEAHLRGINARQADELIEQLLDSKLLLEAYKSERGEHKK